MKEKKSNQTRLSKAEKLEKMYTDIGFSFENDDNMLSSARSLDLSQVSFVPHIEYSVSTVVGGV